MGNYNFDTIVSREGTTSVKYDLREKIFNNGLVTPMWVADMDFETPDFIRRAIEKRVEHPIYGYSFRDENYTASIQNWIRNRHHWNTESDWFVFSPGIVPAVNFAVLTLSQPGDGILIQPPVYFPFYSAIKDHQRKLLTNQLICKNGEYSIDFDDFEKKAKESKLFIMSSPHNPVGRVWTREELSKMGEVCLRHGVIILSDEIHNDLILPGNQHTVMATISDEIANQTLTCIAPSKTFNMAGLATSSVVISNPDLRERFAGFIDRLHLSGGNLFGSVASVAGYTHGEQWVDELMKYVANNVRYLSDFLKSQTLIKVIEPQATYMAWLDFRTIGIDDEAIKNKLIFEAGVGLSPGHVFGAGGEGFQRINLATPFSIVKEAASMIASTFNK